jgi:UDP-glucose 4-epimerase
VRILITGISGFIGGSLGRYAVNAGQIVLGTGRSHSGSPNWTGPYVQTDASAEGLSEIIRNFVPDALLHAAGTASVSSSLADPLSDFSGAALVTASVLEAVRLADLKTLVVIPSSAAVYGNPASLPVSESAPIQPISPYGFHKAICELLAREYAENFGLNIIACRLFSVFGPLQHRLLVWELFQQLAGSETIAWLEGTGSESRDFLHVDDAAAALFQLLESIPNDRTSGHFNIVNIASGKETSVTEIAEHMREMIAPAKKVSCRGASRQGDPVRWCADISRLRALVPSWQPRPLIERLADCLGVWQKEAALLAHG